MGQNARALVARVRVDKGAVNDFIDDVWTNYKAGGRESIQTAISEATINAIIKRYEDKIRNGFSRAGIDLPAGELTGATLLEVIKDQTGLELDSLDPDSVTAAVDRLLSKRVSSALQVNVTSVFDRQTLIEGINDAVIASIKSGRASRWVSGKVFKAAKRYAAMNNAGVTIDVVRKIEARKRMKKYRETHRLVWDN